MAGTMTRRTPRDLYDDLCDLDVGMAAAYKRAVGRSFNGTINETEALTIFRQATDGKKITSDEAEALVLILQSGRFDTGAKAVLKKEIKKKKQLLYNKDARHELTGNQLNDIKAALSPAAVKDINFKSLKTPITYLSTHYSVIWKLIMKDEIDVYEIDARGLNRVAGLGGANYRSSQNELNVYKTTRSASWQALVIHEATHAIQDWLDLRDSEVRFIEADAYTAQGIACHRLGVSVSTDLTHPLASAYHGTAKLIYEPRFRREAGFSDRFKAQYNELVRVISQYPLYKEKYDDDRDFSDDRDGKSEKAIFNKLHKQFKKA